MGYVDEDRYQSPSDELKTAEIVHEWETRTVLKPT